MKQKDDIHLPLLTPINAPVVQNRLAIVLRNLPAPKSRRELVIHVPRTICEYEGRIFLANGYLYPRDDVDSVMGHESGRQISMMIEMKDGALRYPARTMTYPRLLALYCYIAIQWPDIAKDIVK
ncbi:hypothetical protein AB835_10850 [Candidatus Endobugula sertula]|uniref:Uncharacterized protein n=1 Tax=Candidatus Endobugula sertula TaxID=62101 RepID=A0A1D2QN96_9GAMM|nr:hypothetical protein AB835_10850 [Candidatus Endobugula sertula]